MPRYLLRSALPVWALAVVAVIVVAVLDPQDYLSWMPLALAGCVLLALAIQLAISEKDGLVNRLAASLAGALVLLALATGVFALVGA